MLPFKCTRGSHRSHPTEFISEGAADFIRLCLTKRPDLRPTARQLLTHPWIRELLTWQADEDFDDPIMVSGGAQMGRGRLALVLQLALTKARLVPVLASLLAFVRILIATASRCAETWPAMGSSLSLEVTAGGLELGLRTRAGPRHRTIQCRAVSFCLLQCPAACLARVKRLNITRSAVATADAG